MSEKSGELYMNSCSFLDESEVQVDDIVLVLCNMSIVRLYDNNAHLNESIDGICWKESL